jgi:hypothetical protein
LTQDQVDVLQEAIEATQLKHIDIDACTFANDGTLEQLLSACTKVKNMRVRCEFISHFSALSTLLQDTTNSLENMVAFTRANNVDCPDSPDGYEILREVTFYTSTGSD